MNSRPAHLLVRNPSKVRNNHGVLDNDDQCRHDTVVIKGMCRRVVAQVRSEASPHRRGPDGTAFIFEEERSYVVAPPEHEEGIGMDGFLDILVPKVASGAVWRIQLDELPTLVSRRRDRRCEVRVNGVGVRDVAQQLPQTPPRYGPPIDSYRIGGVTCAPAPPREGNGRAIPASKHTEGAVGQNESSTIE